MEGLVLQATAGAATASKARHVGSGSEFRAHLTKSGITAENYETLFQPLVDLYERYAGLCATPNPAYSLQRCQRFLKTVYCPSADPSQFRFCVEDDSSQQRMIGYWCLHSGRIFQQVVQRGRFHSVLVTSGTLTPLEAVCDDLGLHFPIRLQNGHVAPLQNLFLGVMHQDPQGNSMTSAYRLRSELPQRLGRSVLQLAQCIPHGILVFFTSFEARDQVLAAWRRIERGATLLQQLSQVVDSALHLLPCTSHI